MSAKKDKAETLHISPIQAGHKFVTGDKYEAGIQLSGTEVKSIRTGNIQISESFARIIKENYFCLMLMFPVSSVALKIMKLSDLANFFSNEEKSID